MSHRKRLDWDKQQVEFEPPATPWGSAVKKAGAGIMDYD
jgi:hypothetical protein